MRCPVCEVAAGRFFLRAEDRDYWRCDTCLATFLDPSQRPSAEVELARYRLHRNDPQDTGYRRFLDRLASPLLQRLPPARQGLDYGCGPGPALAAMLEEAGHEVTLFDPFFEANPEALARVYDFITCTEAAEHFHFPGKEFRKLDGMLNAGGWLAVMTEFQRDDARFAGWYYRRDPTHVVFYRKATLLWIARRYGWHCEFPCPNVALMQKEAKETSVVTATKEKPRFFLQEKKGQGVSGESLTQALPASRAAICKHMKRLREPGCDGRSAARKGARFRRSMDRLPVGEIQRDLGTHVFGKGPIHYFDEIDSTNNKAKSLAAKGAPEGTLVVAEKQCCGKGTRGRTWFSPNGGLYLSLIVRPPIAAGEAPRITLMTSVAAAEALLSLADMPVAVKWPNDILVGGKKLAGILAEMSTNADLVDYIVVGLGLNVNTAAEDFPVPLGGRATSLLVETGGRIPRVRVARAFLEHFEKCYDQLSNEGFDPVLRRWRALSNVFGRQVRIEAIGNACSGEVVDVDSDGALIIQDRSGRFQRVLSGDLCIIE
jgi:biotin-[acetyl-CoA-carboxylase] ligase BirA-like protein